MPWSGERAARIGRADILVRRHDASTSAGFRSVSIAVLACFLGGVDPFGGFGRVAPVIVALFILQVLSSGLKLMGASQHLPTAVLGLFLIGVMI